MVDFHHTTLHQKVQFWLDTIDPTSDQGQEFFTCILVGFWTIWKVRNEKVFNNAHPDPCRTVIRINKLSATILDAFNQHKFQLPHPTHDPQLRSVAFPLPGNSYNRWKFFIGMHVDRSTGFYGVAAVGNDTIGNQILLWHTLECSSILHSRLLFLRLLLFKDTRSQCDILRIER
ncbi:hypothetical protein GOBAR_DD23476 [Gossypium barbadense]|nr:hypothetical protein GOBAR_DD23476 [Gossypium barbadense]